MELGGDIFDAEYIMKDRQKNGKTEYLIKWRGWDTRFSTWEPSTNILDDRLLNHYASQVQKNTSVTNSAKSEENVTNGLEVNNEVTMDTEKSVPSKNDDNVILPNVLPKTVIGKNKFWQQKSVADLFQMAYEEKIEFSQVEVAVRVEKKQLMLRYRDFIQKKTHVEKLKRLNTYSNSLGEVLPCNFQCRSCKRNYPTKDSLKNHLVFHVKNLKILKRRKYSTAEDQLALEQYKELLLKRPREDRDPNKEGASRSGAALATSGSSSSYDYNRHTASEQSGGHGASYDRNARSDDRSAAIATNNRYDASSRSAGGREASGRSAPTQEYNRGSEDNRGGSSRSGVISSSYSSGGKSGDFGENNCTNGGGEWNSRSSGGIGQPSSRPVAHQSSRPIPSMGGEFSMAGMAQFGQSVANPFGNSSPNFLGASVANANRYDAYKPTGSIGQRLY